MESYELNSTATKRLLCQIFNSTILSLASCLQSYASLLIIGFSYYLLPAYVTV